MPDLPKLPRGVTVKINKTTGRATIRIVDAEGVCRCEVRMAAADLDRFTLVACENWLNQKDPAAEAVAPAVRSLRLVS